MVPRSTLGVAIACLVATVVLVRPGGADTAIRPGVGIGPIRLGMTEQAVRKALGRPNTEQRARSGKTHIVNLNYYMRGEYRVTLRGRRGALRVSLIGTISKSQKTPNGLGIGSSEAQLRSAYASLSCTNVRGSAGGVIRRECRAGVVTRPHSVFVIGAGPNAPVVIEILVVAGGS